MVGWGAGKLTLLPAPQKFRGKSQDAAMLGGMIHLGCGGSHWDVVGPVGLESGIPVG